MEKGTSEPHRHEDVQGTPCQVDGKLYSKWLGNSHGQPTAIAMKWRSVHDNLPGWLHVPPRKQLLTGPMPIKLLWLFRCICKRIGAHRSSLWSLLLLSTKTCLSSKVIGTDDASPDSPPACMGWKTSAKIMLNPACEGWSSSTPRMAVPYQLRDGPSDCHHRWPPECRKEKMG